MSTKFDFKEQIKVGDRGQELFLQNYHSPLVVFPEHKADFKRVSDGKLVELKTDTYNMEKTPNFFWEYLSDIQKLKPGGPWQSRMHRVPVFCYMFVRHNVYYEFDTKELVKFLTPIAEEIHAKNKLLWIKNKGWITGGFTYPREAMKHLYTEHRFEVKQ